jgi:hypothetical protein
MDASGETFGNEGGPVSRQVLLENFERVTTLFGIPRSENEGQIGGERLLAYEFVHELATDAQSQAAGEGELVRYDSAR